MLLFRHLISSSSPPSSSIGTTGHCGLWPVEQCPPIFSLSAIKLSPSSHSQHLKISFYFLFPSFLGSSPSSRPFQFLSEDFWASYPPPFSLGDHFTIFSPFFISSSSQLSPSSHSQHLKISFYFLFPSFPVSSPSSRPFQF